MEQLEKYQYFAVEKKCLISSYEIYIYIDVCVELMLFILGKGSKKQNKQEPI